MKIVVYGAAVRSGLHADSEHTLLDHAGSPRRSRSRFPLAY